MKFSFVLARSPLAHRQSNASKWRPVHAVFYLVDFSNCPLKLKRIAESKCTRGTDLQRPICEIEDSRGKANESLGFTVTNKTPCGEGFVLMASEGCSTALVVFERDLSANGDLRLTGNGAQR